MIKPQYVVSQQSKARLIDSNVKIEALQKEVERKEIERKTMEAQNSEADFIDGIEMQHVVYADPQITIETAQVKSNQILEDAQRQANTMIDEARHEKEQIYDQAFQEAKKDGYRDGYRDGTLSAQLEYDEKVVEWEQKIKQIQDEYEEKQNQMEPLIVDTFLDVFEKVFKIQITDKREIILSLIKKSILHIDNTKDFRIFLNRTQLDYLNENFQRFQQELGQGKTVDCFSDDSLLDEQCRIETDFGTYHCGFDTYFKNLVKEIKTLSI